MKAYESPIAKAVRKQDEKARKEAVAIRKATVKHGRNTRK